MHSIAMKISFFLFTLLSLVAVCFGQTLIGYHFNETRTCTGIISDVDKYVLNQCFLSQSGSGLLVKVENNDAILWYRAFVAY